METFDVIVVGLGAMGTSACMHLARRGLRVLGVEQFDIPHTRGSSHGESRLIRLCYYEHPDYVPLLRRAYDLWDQLAIDSGSPVLHRTGGLYIGAEDGELIAGSLRSAREHNIEHQVLSSDQLTRRFPQFRAPPGLIAMHEPAAGWLAPERAVSAAANLAMAHGATLRAREPVLEWSSDAAGAWVRTFRAEHRARRIVFTAGAWAERLLSSLGVRVAPTRQLLAWFKPDEPGSFVSPQFPVWAFEPRSPPGAPAELFYGFPNIGELPGVKLARHAPGPHVNPDDPDPASDHAESDHAELARLRAFTAAHLPRLSPDLLALRSCIYENSPDGHFIIDAPSSRPNTIIAAGFSGHGFKFASVVGEILADLAERNATSHPIGFLGLSRFQPAQA